MNAKTNKVTLNELISLKMASLQLEGKWATSATYQSVLHQIEKNYGIVLMRDVNAGLMNDWKNRLKQQGISDSTISTYFSNIKAIWNYAQYKKYVKEDNYPFQRKSYEIDRVKVPKVAKRNDRAIEKSDIQKLWDWWKQAPEDKNWKRRRKVYVGLWLASYLGGGANLADIFRWQYNGDWYKSGGKVITFIRSKTKGRSDTLVKIPVTPHLRHIIEDMGAEPSPDGLIFPELLCGLRPTDGDKYRFRILTIGSECRKRMLEVVEQVGIKETISPTWARHSFASIMNRIGCPFALVEKMMGHCLPGVSGHYIADAPVEELEKWCSMLLD